MPKEKIKKCFNCQGEVSITSENLDLEEYKCVSCGRIHTLHHAIKEWEQKGAASLKQVTEPNKKKLLRKTRSSGSTLINSTKTWFNSASPLKKIYLVSTLILLFVAITIFLPSNDTLKYEPISYTTRANQIRINMDHDFWSDVTIKINNKYFLKIDRLTKGYSTISLSEFADKRGRRFNPDTTKPVNVKASIASKASKRNLSLPKF